MRRVQALVEADTVDSHALDAERSGRDFLFPRPSLLCPKQLSRAHFEWVTENSEVSLSTRSGEVAGFLSGPPSEYRVIRTECSA